MKKEAPLNQHLSETFDKLRLSRHVETPEDLKTAVFESLDTLSFIGDVVDLFTLKFGQSEASLINLFEVGAEEEEE